MNEMALYESVVAALINSKTSDSTYTDMALLHNEDGHFLVYLPSEYTSGYQPIPELVFNSLIRDAGLVEAATISGYDGFRVYYARPGTTI